MTLPILYKQIHLGEDSTRQFKVDVRNGESLAAERIASQQRVGPESVGPLAGTQMKLAALPTLIAAGESLTLEQKKSTAEKGRACRSLCALANGQGGQVVFGVTPAGQVVGQKVTDRTLEELAQGFEPPQFTHLQRIPVSEG